MFQHDCRSVCRNFAAWIVAGAIGMFLTASVTFAAPAASEEPDGELTLGAQFGDQQFEGFGDVILPLSTAPDGLLFFSPRFSGNDGKEEELNLGIGYRRLINGDSMIVGGNVYYDTRWSSADNRFDQAGVGLEFFSEWVDARCNAYLANDEEKAADSYTEETIDVNTLWDDPWARHRAIKQAYTEITTTTLRTYELREAAMSGYDAEVGVRLPYVDRYAETRVFVGYQSFDNPFGDDYGGMKARLEARLFPAVTFDAQYLEDEDLNGTDYYVGLRVNLPFAVDRIAKGQNPFAGAGDRLGRAGARPVSSRLTEMVIRDLKVRSATSESFVENVKKTVSSTETNIGHVTVFSDITFVDGDNDSGIEDGTLEHPFDEIQEGIDHANSPVFVWDAASPYLEHVWVPNGVQLWGNGRPVPCHGGKGYGTGIYPVIGSGGFNQAKENNAELMDGVVTLGNFRWDLGVSPSGVVLSETDTEVSGFHIIAPEGGGIVGNRLSGNYRIEGNIIESESSGIAMGMGGASSDDLPVTRKINMLISGNRILSEDFKAIELNTGEFEELTAVISGNDLESYRGSVVALAFANSRQNLTISGNNIVAIAPAFAAVGCQSFEDGWIDATVSGNYIESGNDGIDARVAFLGQSPDRTVIMRAYNNEIHAGMRSEAGVSGGETVLSRSAAGIMGYAVRGGQVGLDLRGNAITTPDDDDIVLLQSNPALLYVRDAPNLEANNYGADVVGAGTVYNSWPF